MCKEVLPCKDPRHLAACPANERRLQKILLHFGHSIASLMLLKVLIIVKKEGLEQEAIGHPNSNIGQPSNFEGDMNVGWSIGLFSITMLFSPIRHKIPQEDLRNLKIIDFHKQDHGVLQ